MIEYTVKQGDTLWSIAEKCLGSAIDWGKVADANRDLLNDPKRRNRIERHINRAELSISFTPENWLFVGEVLKVPVSSDLPN